jgi:hypothetical protein
MVLTREWEVFVSLEVEKSLVPSKSNRFLERLLKAEGQRSPVAVSICIQTYIYTHAY